MNDPRSVTSQLRSRAYIDGALGLLLPFIPLAFGAALMADASAFGGPAVLLCFAVAAAGIGALVFWGAVTYRRLVWLKISDGGIVVKKLAGFGAEQAWRLHELDGYTVHEKWIKSEGAVEQIAIWKNGQKVIIVLQPLFSNYLFLKDAIERRLQPLR